jgi:IgGFc binding protein
MGGTYVTAEDCANACDAAVGCVVCPPGSNFCQDGNVIACDASGNPGGVVEMCTGVTTCAMGACVNACDDAAESKSYIGCEYYAVDLDNAIEVLGVIGQELGDGSTLTQQKCTTANGTSQNMDVCFQNDNTNTVISTAGLCDPPAGTCPNGYTCGQKQACILNAQGSPFAIVVSNPQSKAANVTVTGVAGQPINQVVAAGAVTAIFPQANASIPDQSVDGTVLARKAYQVTSDLPIVAYQFNPLNNVNVFSNDASLLIPRTAWDMDYYAMSYPTLNRRQVGFFETPQHPYYGFVTIVAWQDGTVIAVTPKTAVQASATQQTIAAGSTVMFTLNAMDVLQLEAAPAALPAGDLTGTHISSANGSFGVFGGHEATLFGEVTPPDQTHTRGPCCADHLEEMLFPSSTWGKTFAITRSQVRTNEPDMLRIMAQKPGTTVTFAPAPQAGTCGTLSPGQFCEVKIGVDTQITATEPVLIGHYLQSSTWQDTPILPFFPVDTIGTGDPSMAIAVPTEQFRKDYTILVPSQYSKNYISIAAAATGGVTIDGVAVTLAPYPGGGTYRAARVEVTAGQHKIACADGCGITVYGYSNAVSYMFAGGLDLKPIVIF